MTLLLALCLGSAVAPEVDRPRVIVVVGSPGAPEYDSQFRQAAGHWQTVAAKAGADLVRIGDSDASAGSTDRDRLRAALADPSSTTGREHLWLVLIGHGTSDGRESKFNLRGPDVTDKDLSDWLAAVKRPVALINGASASGPFLNRISGPNRVIITATRSADEQNFARFGKAIAETIGDPASDLDKDGQVSLLEAYLAAAAKVTEYYKSRSQLATEHPLLDDNGDKLGTPPDWFRGVHATRRAKDGAALDGARAHQLHLVLSDRERGIPVETRRRRDQLEVAVAALRDQKTGLTEDVYYRKLEPVLLELSRLYRDLEQTRGATNPLPR